MTKCPCLNEPQQICTCSHYFSLQIETVEVLHPLQFQINMSIQDQSLFSYFRPTAKKKKNEENRSAKFYFITIR